MSLAQLGWNDHFASAFSQLPRPDWVPARLRRETPINFEAYLADGRLIEVVVSGKVWHEAQSDAELPAVGDWVAVEMDNHEDGEHLIRARLSRQSHFSRKAPGKSSQEQVLAANVDLVVVVTDPGPDFNLRRLERYHTLIRRSGAQGLILLNKADLFSPEHNQAALAQIRDVAPDLQVALTSLHTGQGLDLLTPHLRPGHTLTLAGSSGVGKSTLVNHLLGHAALETGEVNEVTGKGRHTTVARELVKLPSGALLIDNPGIREVHLWVDEHTLRESFRDLDELATQCHFRDCRHGPEKGCAIQQAITSGQLSPQRLQAFLNLEDEILELNKRRKKRQINIERRAKRAHRVKARNLQDRIQLEKDERGEL